MSLAADWFLDIRAVGITNYLFGDNDLPGIFICGMVSGQLYQLRQNMEMLNMTTDFHWT